MKHCNDSSFWMWPVFEKSLLNLMGILVAYNSAYVLWGFWFSGPQGMWDPSSPTRGKPTAPALEGEVLATEPPGKSQHYKSTTLQLKILIN